MMESENLLIAYKKGDIDKLLSIVNEANKKLEQNRLILESTNQRIELLEHKKRLEPIAMIDSSDIMNCLNIGKTKFHKIKSKLPFLKRDESGKIFAYRNDFIQYIRENYPEPYYESTKKILTNTE
jgi:hypothetical protein